MCVSQGVLRNSRAEDWSLHLVMKPRTGKTLQGLAFKEPNCQSTFLPRSGLGEFSRRPLSSHKTREAHLLGLVFLDSCLSCFWGEGWLWRWFEDNHCFTRCNMGGG